MGTDNFSDKSPLSVLTISLIFTSGPARVFPHDATTLSVELAVELIWSVRSLTNLFKRFSRLWEESSLDSEDFFHSAKICAVLDRILPV